MKNDNETRSKLLASAAEEFMEKGYMQASLRNICKKVGVTTGALYFFFQDKEDLFSKLVEEPLQQLLNVMKQHYAEEQEEFKKEVIQIDGVDDLKAARQVIHIMYQHKEAFILLLTKAQGSRFENVVDRFVEVTEQQYRILVQASAKRTGKKPVDDYVIHWMAHMNIEVFIHILTHEIPEEKALENIAIIVNYLIQGYIHGFQVTME